LYRDVGTPKGYPYVGVVTDEPFPQYISVHSSYHTEMTKQILQYVTGEPVSDQECEDIDECQSNCYDKNKDQQIYSYQFLVGPDCHNETGAFCAVCYRTSVAKKNGAESSI